jgi:hypothetical protein
MDYHYFINRIKHHETDRIRAFRGARRTKPEQIPDAFALLMPEIIKILQLNISRICPTGMGMVIFGLQPAGGMSVSNRPQLLNRRVKGQSNKSHFCCTLDYVLSPMEKIGVSEGWDHTHSIVIDFTSGEIMDCDRYHSQLFNKPETGVLFGRINNYTLNIVWKVVHIKENTLTTPVAEPLMAYQI